MWLLQIKDIWLGIEQIDNSNDEWNHNALTVTNNKIVLPSLFEKWLLTWIRGRNENMW